MLFGISSVVLGAILFVAGLLALMKGSIGTSIRGVFGAIPIGTPKLWAVIAVVIGLALGGAGFVWGGATGLFHSATTASQVNTQNGVIATSLLNCQMNTPTEETTASNITFRSDPNDLTHQYADVKYTNGAYSINGSLFCTDTRSDIRQGAAHDCHVEAQSFRSETSTTDSNTYYIVATSTTASQVPGYAWQQNVNLKDEGTTNSGAVTTDPKEKASLVFAQDEATQYLGYNVTLPGATVFGYLNNQTSKDVKFVCDGKTVGTLTITKTTA